VTCLSRLRQAFSAWAIVTSCQRRRLTQAVTRLLRRSPFRFALMLPLSCGLLLPWCLQAWGQATTAAIAETPSAWSPNVFQAIILGLVQGLTEFIPISSTAHLMIVPQLLGWGDPGVAFSATIQLGSILAVLSYFWRDLLNIGVGSLQAIDQQDWKARDLRLAIGIAIGTLPIIVVGLGVRVLFADFYETHVRTTSIVAIVSIVMGLLLGLAEQICKHRRPFDTLGTQDGILIGLAQALAVVPGVSRSGSTITAALFLGLDRPTAARFSFLLGIPAITLGGLFELKDLVSATGGLDVAALVAGLVSAAVFSYLSIAWLIRFLQTRSTWVFVGYRVVFGLVILLAASQGWISN